MAYKVDLEIYNGPMDLLLYLIRREEVDIRDIPILRIADQYIAYLDLLKSLDIELAGDFIVMAATLLELKSAAVLPRPPEPEEGEEPEAEEDPRETLIRQLIEYRRFKEAAAMLDDRGRDMARRFPRQVDDRALAGLTEESDMEVPTDFLKGTEIWDLISAFSQVIRTLGYSEARQVIYDDTPVEEAARKLIERIEAEKSLLFTQLFTGGHSRVYLVTMFIAVLELVRQRRIGAEQTADFKDLRLYLCEPTAEPPVQQTPLGVEAYKEALERKGPRRPSVRQTDDLREMIEEVDFEKTEFDHILDSIKVPEVESFKPIYSEEELLGKKGEGAEASAEASVEVNAGADASAAAAAQDQPPADAEAGDKPECEAGTDTDAEPKP